MTHPAFGDYRDKVTARSTWVFIAFALVAAYFLAMEHRAHLSNLLYYVPYLLLLACPLMHLFHHRGHSSRHGRATDVSGTDGEPR